MRKMWVLEDEGLGGTGKQSTLEKQQDKFLQSYSPVYLSFFMRAAENMTT